MPARLLTCAVSRSGGIRPGISRVLPTASRGPAQGAFDLMSAHTAERAEELKAVARQLLHAHQDSLDFGDGRPRGAALPMVSTRSQHLWDALQVGYRVLG